MARRGLRALFASMFLLGTIGAAGAVAHPGLHGGTDDHLIGDGDWGKLELVGTWGGAEEGITPNLIADVGVDPSGDYAYLANWGEPDCAGPETGGMTSPDAGIYVIDIRDPSDPELVNFLPLHQDTRPGEGVQVVEITTTSFSGTILAVNEEACGKNGKGGFSLWDVTDPLKPKKLATNFGDFTLNGERNTPHEANETHSVFIWDAGDKAYLVETDNEEFEDVNIYDITNPKHPVLIAEISLDDFPAGTFDPEEVLGDNPGLHDMVVKEIDGRFYLLLSYWDAGWVVLDVTDLPDWSFISDFEYPSPDTLTGLTPAEGNAHQAEWTIDDRFIIGTDEDFSPFRTEFRITSGPDAGLYPDVSGEFSWTIPLTDNPDIEDGVLNGPVIYGGYGCLASPEEIPDASLLELEEGEEAILVLSRGPVSDPGAPYEACNFSEKVELAQEAGYDAVIIANHHVGADAGGAPDATLCGSQGHEFEITISAFCVGHETFHMLFGTEPAFDVPYVDGTEPEIGAIGADIQITSTFDGWGYVRLIDAATMEEVDAFAIPEALDPAFATGFGDLSVHEVAVDPLDPTLAYLSYYAGGVRAIQIVCTDPADTSTCELVEVGGYLGEEGNDFWGVETFIGDDGRTYVLASDMDYGLFIFVDP